MIYNHLDELVDSISKDFEIKIKKPRTYPFIDEGYFYFEVDGPIKNRTVKEAVFAIPKKIRGDHAVLKGYFAHEIAETSRYFDGYWLQKVWGYIAEGHQNSQEYFNKVFKEDKCNPFKFVFNAFKILILKPPYLIGGIINNMAVDRLAKQKGYRDSITATRKTLGHISLRI